MLNAFGNRRYFFIFTEEGGKNMLKTLLSVIRAVIVELVNQLLRKTCNLG